MKPKVQNQLGPGSVRGEGSEGENQAGGLGPFGEGSHNTLISLPVLQPRVKDLGQPADCEQCPYFLPINSTPTLGSRFPSGELS